MTEYTDTTWLGTCYSLCLQEREGTIGAYLPTLRNRSIDFNLGPPDSPKVSRT